MKITLYIITFIALFLSPDYKSQSVRGEGYSVERYNNGDIYLIKGSRNMNYFTEMDADTSVFRNSKSIATEIFINYSSSNGYNGDGVITLYHTYKTSKIPFNSVLESDDYFTFFYGKVPIALYGKTTKCIGFNDYANNFVKYYCDSNK